MAAQVLTKEAAAEARIALVDGGRGSQAVHEVVVAMRAARRSGSANTKTKAEVNLSGAKPWRQKGTGRARAGYKSSPIWRGGGVVFGPKPRDYSKKISKSVRRLAFQKALSERIAAGDVLTVGEFAVKELTTKAFVSLLKKQTDARRVLIVSDNFDDNTYKSARNVKPVQLATANEVNTEQLLAFEKILVTNGALAKLADRIEGAPRPGSLPEGEIGSVVARPDDEVADAPRAASSARPTRQSRAKTKAKTETRPKPKKAAKKK